MCPRDPNHQSYTSSKAIEAGFHLYEPSVNVSTTNSSTTSSSSISSSTTPGSSTAKRRKWYRPNLNIHLHKDWIWVGFIRAGHTTPTGRAQSGVENDIHENLEQLPAYAPPEEGLRQPIEMVEECSTNRVDDWIVEPPDIERHRGGGGESGVEPPAYR